MACKRSGVQIPLAPRETAGQSLFTRIVTAGPMRLLQPLVQPDGPTETRGTWSATVPGMPKEARRARLAGLKIASRQTDPAGECSFKPGNLGPNALRARTSSDADAIRASQAPSNRARAFKEPEPSLTS